MLIETNKNIDLFKRLINLWLLLSFITRLIDSDYFYQSKGYFLGHRSILGTFHLVDKISYSMFLSLLVICIGLTLVNYFKDHLVLTITLYASYIVLIYSRIDSIIGGDSLFYIVGFWNIFLSASPKSRTQEHLNEWIIITLKFQLCLIYFAGGMLKIQSSIWRQGAALHYILNLRLFQGYFYSIILDSNFLTLALSWFSIMFQLSFPYLIISKNTKYVALILGLGFHAGSIMVMNLTKFSIFPILYVLFWNRDEFDSWIGFVKKKVGMNGYEESFKKI